MNGCTLKYHPHLHAIATDGLFRDTGTFYVMRQTDLKPLEDLFRAEVFKFLRKEAYNFERIKKLIFWGAVILSIVFASIFIYLSFQFWNSEQLVEQNAFHLASKEAVATIFWTL